MEFNWVHTASSLVANFIAFGILALGLYKLFKSSFDKQIEQMQVAFEKQLLQIQREFDQRVLALSELFNHEVDSLKQVVAEFKDDAKEERKEMRDSVKRVHKRMDVIREDSMPRKECQAYHSRRGNGNNKAVD